MAVEITGNVIPRQDFYRVGTLYAAKARLGAHYSLTGRFEPFVTLAGGYSVISLADTSPCARGVVVGGAAGLKLKLGTAHRLFAQLGYEAGFQKLDGHAYGPRFLVTEFGWALAF
jgi:hypothetical protein